MNISDLIVRSLQNKHTSGSALALFAATAVGVIWPQHKDKADELARAAIIYGLVTAGDARPTPPPPADQPTQTPAPAPEKKG